jgi:hypothetical protein
MGYTQPARSSSVDTTVTCELTVCQSYLFFAIHSLSMPYAMTIFHTKAKPLACREFCLLKY